ncbi:integrin alpha-X-like isoform X2 [Hypomesus transpacificus]|uniref:integrin alpha-X-like isoform X2 n=1 Tax=Hypomesus transpacificus TaxID=137520 RepID=UPI001F075012|nr:integrin alpha-X-like isoform X2 [Hypomesus transpacificus]
MDHLWSLIVLLHIAPLTWAFNLDIHFPRVFKNTDAQSRFGYRVCHFGPARDKSVLVTAPFLANGTGGLYWCSYDSGQCKAVPVQVDPGIAFGLSLACSTDRVMVCGPHLVHACDSFNYLNGLCVQLDSQLTVMQKLKPAYQDCHDFGLDAVILFDSSQSISKSDFDTMITFIKDIVRMFTDTSVQVAVAQYSTDAHAVFHFQNFAVDRNPDNLMKLVTHSEGNTYTPSAIRYVLEKMLTEERGMRRNSRKLLVVITDGKSNDPKESFEKVLPLAEERGVVRIAVGVGNQVSPQELRQVASSPEGVFETKSFEALKTIQVLIRNQIFNIEGVSTDSARSFKQELSQGGFSTALSGGASVFGAPGSYSWSGGMVESIQGTNDTFINASAVEADMKDSYLGYSVAVAVMEDGLVYFSGAPRYKHTGLVLAFQTDPVLGRWTVSHRVHGVQLGSYFGGELCVLQRPGESDAALLLVGAPSFHEQGVGGEVTVCSLRPRVLNCTHTLRGAAGNELGRFGASLSPCPDLNGDGLLELAVGAPLENRGRGSLYVFLGRPGGGLQTRYSQRIQGVRGASELKFFGLSVHSAGDVNSDGLADLVVGAKGAAVILRSQPVMQVQVSVSLDPPLIPQDYFHCAGALALDTPVATATLCVTVRGIHTGSIKAPLQASVEMSVELDSQNRPARLLFYPSADTSHWAGEVNSTACHNLSISIPGCISDYRPVLLSGRLSVEGQEVPDTGGLRSVLSPDSPTSFTHMVLLEKVCGEDHVCIPDLQVSVNFTSPEVVVVSGFPVELAVGVANSGEDAGGVELTLTHPYSMTFLRAKQSLGQEAVWCLSNSTEVENVTMTTCHLSSVTLRQGSEMKVLMSFEVSDLSSRTRLLAVNVSVGANGEEPDTLHDNFGSSSVAVKLPINIIIRGGDSTQFIRPPETTLIEHIFVVENVGDMAAPVNATFLLPADLTSGHRWSVTLSEPISRTTCETRLLSTTDKETLGNQNCGGVTCLLAACTSTTFSQQHSRVFRFIGNVSLEADGSGGQVEVRSRGVLSFDRAVYAQYPANSFQTLTIVTVLDTPPPSRVALIASVSVLCALLILLVVSGVLFKMGFFTHQVPPSGKEDDTAEPAPTGDPDSLRETVL